MRIRHMAIVATAVAGLSGIGVTANAAPPPPPPPGGSSLPGFQLPGLPGLPPLPGLPQLPPPGPAPKPKPKPPAPAPAGAPCSAAARACVSLSQGKAWLVQNGRVEYGPVKMSAGRASHPTKTGIFHVLRKERNSWSKPFNAPMPYSVYFTSDGVAFHDGSPNELSHGCIHLWTNDAKKFYNTLQVGDMVQVVA